MQTTTLTRPVTLHYNADLTDEQVQSELERLSDLLDTHFEGATLGPISRDQENEADGMC